MFGEWSASLLLLPQYLPFLLLGWVCPFCCLVGLEKRFTHVEHAIDTGVALLRQDGNAMKLELCFHACLVYIFLCFAFEGSANCAKC